MKETIQSRGISPALSNIIMNPQEGNITKMETSNGRAKSKKINMGVILTKSFDILAVTFFNQITVNNDALLNNLQSKLEQLISIPFHQANEKFLIIQTIVFPTLIYQC